MKIKIISYGHKFHEAEGKAPPAHDFLFSLRDLINPYWVPELKKFNGLDEEIKKYFEKDSGTQERLAKVDALVKDFATDFTKNKHRTEDCSLTFAFKCTGGKHRSVYFAQTIFDRVSSDFDEKAKVELEHLEMHRYV